MPTKSSAHYQREYRRRLREQGLVKKEVWVRPEHAKQLLAQEKQLRIPGESARVTTETQRPHWTTTQLHQALLQTDLISLGRATVELIDGIERLTDFYLKAREDGERFVDTYRRLGMAPFKAALYPEKAQAHAA